MNKFKMIPPILIVIAAIAALGSYFFNGGRIKSMQRMNVQLEEDRQAASTQKKIPVPTPTPTPYTLPALAETKQLDGGTHTFQTFNNCGPASLSMALSYYGITEGQQALGNMLRPYQNQQGNNDDKSVTLTELGAAAEQYGFTVYHRPAGSIELLQQFTNNDMPVITRTWLEPNEDIGHYRVVKGYNRTNQTLLQDDSLQGRNLSYPYEDFRELWQAFNYEFLVLVPEGKEEVAEAILAAEGLSSEQASWMSAKQLAEEQVRSDPDDIYAQFNLAVAHYRLGEFQQSVEQYEKVAAKLPGRMLWYQIEPILAYYQLEDYETVLSMSGSIIENNNRAFSELHYLRGKIYEDQGNQAQAEQSFNLADRYNQGEYWLSNFDTIPL